MKPSTLPILPTKLIPISAPVGYGKTTLVSACWYALSDPHQFFRYWAAPTRPLAGGRLRGQEVFYAK